MIGTQVYLIILFLAFIFSQYLVNQVLKIHEQIDNNTFELDMAIFNVLQPLFELADTLAEIFFHRKSFV